MDVVLARMDEEAPGRRRHLETAASDLAATSTQLAIYDAAIAAGEPLPEPSRGPFRAMERKHRKRMWASGINVGEMTAAEYVGELRFLEHLQQEGLMTLRQMFTEIDRQYLEIFVQLARKELDVANSVEAAAWSTTLPGAMGRRVGEGPDTRIA
jgi:hypothetical protein